MKEGGDPDIINLKTEMYGKTQGNIKKMTMDLARLESFADKIDQAHMQQRMGTDMVKVSRALSMVTKNMQLDQIEAVMTDLGKQYEDIDVMTSVLNSATAESTASAASPEQVERLKRQLADEAGLELSQDLNSPGVVTTAPVKSGPTAEQEAESAERLKALRQHA